MLMYSMSTLARPLSRQSSTISSFRPFSCLQRRHAWMSLNFEHSTKEKIMHEWTLSPAPSSKQHFSAILHRARRPSCVFSIETSALGGRQLHDRSCRCCSAAGLQVAHFPRKNLWQKEKKFLQKFLRMVSCPLQTETCQHSPLTPNSLRHFKHSQSCFVDNFSSSPLKTRNLAMYSSVWSLLRSFSWKMSLGKGRKGEKLFLIIMKISSFRNFFHWENC